MNSKKTKLKKMWEFWLLIAFLSLLAVMLFLVKPIYVILATVLFLAAIFIYKVTAVLDQNHPNVLNYTTLLYVIMVLLVLVGLSLLIEALKILDFWAGEYFTRLFKDLFQSFRK